MTSSEIDIDTFIKMYELKFNETLSKNLVFAMKHAVSFNTVDQTFLLKMSRLMDIFMSIVKIVKSCPRNLGDIKKMIDVNNSFFFEFGTMRTYLSNILN